MASKPFDAHDPTAQIDVLRRAVRELWRRHGPVPVELTERYDGDYEALEAARLTKEAEAAHAQVEQAKLAVDKANQQAKEASKTSAQRQAEMAAERAQADLQAKQKIAEEAANAAKAAEAEAAKVAPPASKKK
jgi:hypothetical protein